MQCTHSVIYCVDIIYILYNIRIARENANICIVRATHALAHRPPWMSVVPLGPTGMVKCPNYITDKNNGNKYQILSVEYKKETRPCAALFHPSSGSPPPPTPAVRVSAALCTHARIRVLYTFPTPLPGTHSFLPFKYCKSLGALMKYSFLRCRRSAKINLA